MSTLVMKFGGTSVGSPQAITQVKRIVESSIQESERLVVVVSAMRGVTDSLIQCAKAAVEGDDIEYQSLIEQIKTRHHVMMDDILTDQVEIQ